MKGLFLIGEPSLHADSAIKHSATEACPWRSDPECMPTIDSADVSPQLGGEFFFRQILRKKLLRLRHPITSRRFALRLDHVRGDLAGGERIVNL
jgi:hypothetical protein